MFTIARCPRWAYHAVVVLEKRFNADISTTGGTAQWIRTHVGNYKVVDSLAGFWT